MMEARGDVGMIGYIESGARERNLQEEAQGLFAIVLFGLFLSSSIH